MSRETRVDLIKQIEQKRGSRVLCYVLGDRPPIPAKMSGDAIRPLYDLLREIKATDNIDFFIYSRGGTLDVPWRIVNALRECATKRWNILIPLWANSAATLLALGADEIVMGAQAELGPIDPILTIQRGGNKEDVNVEDVMAYVRFVQSRLGLSDQSALETGLTQLTTRLDALTLGNIYRTHSHIRDVARRVISSRCEPPPEQQTSSIVETLAERVYAHGHAISRREAKNLGLPVVEADADLDGLMWALMGEYEETLRIREPLDPVELVAKTDQYTDPDSTLAILETSESAFAFQGNVVVEARRQVPPTVNVAVQLNNLQVNLPIPAPGQKPDVQPVIAALQQAIIAEAQKAVQEAIRAQAPLTGIEVAMRGGSWRRIPKT